MCIAIIDYDVINDGDYWLETDEKCKLSAAYFIDFETCSDVAGENMLPMCSCVDVYLVIQMYECNNV